MDNPKIFIAGHKGMVGSALVRNLQNQKVDLLLKDRKEVNLLDQHEVNNFFKNERIDQIYLAAQGWRYLC